MGSGLILLLLVGAWLAVLVPVALRSHETSSALATVDKFHDAMRVLSRRDGVARRRDGDGVARRRDGDGVARRRDGDAVAAAHGGQADVGQDASRPSGADDGAAPPRSRRRLTPAARRLRVLVGLVVVAVATLVGALVVSWWLLVPHLLVDLLLVGFVCWLRSRAVAKEEQEWRRAMGERRAAPVVTSVRVTPGRAAARSSVAAPPARVAGIPDRMPSRAALDAAAQRSADAAPPRADLPTPVEVPDRVRGAQGEPWQPVPVPVPTYVSAPLAPRRVVDLTRQAPAASLSTSERSVGVDDHGPEFDHILDRRAVGD